MYQNLRLGGDQALPLHINIITDLVSTVGLVVLLGLAVYVLAIGLQSRMLTLALSR